MSTLLYTVKKLTEAIDDISAAPEASNAQLALSADNMSLAANNTLTHADIHNHLKAADEAAEAVETQTFGLETDEGDIIKVYVAVQDADEFEIALAKKLGEEDDIEEVLDQLADKFDIVDVQWPEEDEVEASNFDDPVDDSEVIHDIEQEKTDDTDADSQLDDVIGDGDPTNDEPFDVKGGQAKDDVSSDVKGGLPKDNEGGQDDEPADDETLKGGLPKDDETEETEDESEDKPKKGGLGKKKSDESDEDDDKPTEDKPKKGGLSKKKSEDVAMDKPKKGGLRRESVELPLIKHAALLESTGASFNDPDISALYHEVPGRQQKLIIKALAALGVPGDVLKLKHSIFKKNLVNAAEMVLQNTHLRIWLAKFVDATEKFIEPQDEPTVGVSHSDHEAPNKMHESLLRSIGVPQQLNEKGGDDDTQEMLRMQIHNRIAALAFGCIDQLGVDSEVFKAKRFAIKKSIGLAAKKIAKNPRAKVALLMVSGALGVAKDPNAFHIVLPDEKKKMDEEDAASKMLRDGTEQIEEADFSTEVSEEGLLGPSQYAELVNKLVVALGIPLANLHYQNSKLRQAINIKRQSIKGLTRVMSRLNQLMDVMGESMEEDFDESDSISKAEMLAGRARRVSEDDKSPADLGDWSISKIDDKLTLKVEHFSISLDDEDIDSLIDSIANGDVHSAKSAGKRITFRPTNRGIDYIIKEFGNQEFPNGILFGQESIDRLSDVLASNV